MTEPVNTRGKLFVSLRLKLLLVFTALFTLGLIAAYFWFSNYAADIAQRELEKNLLQVAETTALDISGDLGDALAAIHDEGIAAQDNADYMLINERLRVAKWNNPRAAGIYTFTFTDDPTLRDSAVQMIVTATVPPGVEKTPRDLQAESLKPEGCQVSSDNRVDVGTVLKREIYGADFVNTALVGLEKTTISEDIYSDPLGSWLTAVSPVYNSEGEIVGAVGVDACAADINRLRDNVKQNVLVVMSGVFLLMVVAVVGVSYSITRPITTLTYAAEQAGGGNYEQDFSHLARVSFGDEVTTLAGVFDMMIDKIAARERSLKKEVANLQIMIDKQKRDQQVQEATDTDFFKDIQAKAAKMRRERRAANADSESDSESESE